jgi:hypothetical protein
MRVMGWTLGPALASRWLVLGCVALSGGWTGCELAAADAAFAPPPLPGWACTGRLGLFANTVSTANADTSRDSEVNSSVHSTSFIGTLDGTLWWRGENTDEVEQRLQARYGISRTGEGDWTETSDFIEYDGVYRHRYALRRALYGSLTGVSAFVGPDPWNAPFDPLKAALAAGHSWLYDNMMPLSDRLEVRCGVRIQKTWGRSLDPYLSEVETGPEVFLRYQRQQTPDLSWWAQFDLFSEFNDLGHVEALGTAALQLQLTSIIAVDLRVRTYYERRPSDLPERLSTVAYDRIGLRGETLIGATISW